MVWTIIGVIILIFFWGMFKKGSDIEKQKKMEQKEQERQEQQFVSATKEKPNLLQEQWERRVKQLNIDLSKTERVIVLYRYQTNQYNTWDKMYTYIWDVEGAIASFRDYRQEGLDIEWVKSPLEWPIIYFNLKDIDGIYERNDVTLVQYKDGSVNAFALSDCSKVKEVYRKAKERTI